MAVGTATSGARAGLIAAASWAVSSMDSGLMATEVGGLRTMGGPFGKRSGCAP